MSVAVYPPAVTQQAPKRVFVPSFVDGDLNLFCYSCGSERMDGFHTDYYNDDGNQDIMILNLVMLGGDDQCVGCGRPVKLVERIRHRR